jgi:hypothetical protein
MGFGELLHAGAIVGRPVEHGLFAPQTEVDEEGRLSCISQSLTEGDGDR